MIQEINRLADNIKSLLEPFGKKHNVHEPYFDKNSIGNIKKCIESSYVSTSGQYVTDFKKKLSLIIGSPRVVLTSSGTASLHLALNVIGIEGKEVLLPSMTFVATTNSIKYNLGIPHFIDVEKENVNIDPVKLEKYLKLISVIKNNRCYNKSTKKEIKCLILVHAFGHPADIDKIQKLCKMYCLEIVEDAAGALGSRLRNKHVGTFGRFGIISFNGNKIITTGMGGAIICKNNSDYKKIMHLSSTARIQHPWKIEHNQIGYNYRMANLNASLGVSQLKSLNKFIKNKKKLHLMYLKLSKDNDLFDILENSNGNSNYWLNNLILKPQYKKFKVKLIKRLHKNNIFVRELWTPQHILPMYKKCEYSNLDNTIDLWQRTISLPSSFYNGL